MPNKTHTEKTSAETTSIGFDFQYYFFLWKLLSLNKGETVGLEVKDDVHTQINNTINFFQVKHSIQKNAQGNIKNLTSNDKDLWKTLHNWVSVITDENDGRQEVSNQIIFVKNSEFILWSNKSYDTNNIVVHSVKNYQSDKLSLQDFIEQINILKNDSNDQKNIEYMNKFLSLDSNVLEIFISNITFELEEDDIIQDCKNAIQAKLVPLNQINDVFDKVDSNVRQKNFEDIKNGKKIIYSFDDFYTQFQKYFNVTRDGSLPRKKFDFKPFNKMEEQTFIKQLVEINDVEINNLEEISKYTDYKFQLDNYLLYLLSEGLITTEEIDSHTKDALVQWENKFKRHIGRNAKNDNSKSHELIDDIRDLKLNIDGEELDTNLSNGQFYNLSDIPDIGWTKDWEKYKK